MPLLTVFLIAAGFGGWAAVNGMNDDQMLFYQTALRIVSGQVPYRDFAISQGAVTGLVLSPFLWLAPTGGWGYVLASALLNGATAMVAYRFVAWARFKADGWAWVAGLLTAVWFLPLMGGFYSDHLAYLLVFAAGLCWTSSRKTAIPLCALLFVLAYHTKQTVGLPGLLALVVTDGFLRRKKSLAPLTSLGGYLVLGHGLVLLLVYTLSDLDGFLHSTVTLAIDRASHLSQKNPIGLIRGLLFPWTFSPWLMVTQPSRQYLAFYSLVLLAYLALARSVKGGATVTTVSADADYRHRYALLFSVLSTLWCSSLLGRTHFELFFGMGVACVLALTKANGQTFFSKRVTAVYVTFLLILGTVFMTGKARGPSPHPDEYFGQSDLRPVRMAKGAATNSLVDLARVLESRPGDLVILGQKAAYVAAALRRAPIQPGLNDASFTLPHQKSNVARWNSEFLRSLTRRTPRYVVLHRSWLRTPQIKPVVDHILSHYRVLFEQTSNLVYEALPSPDVTGFASR